MDLCMWLRTSFLGSRDFNSHGCRAEGDDLGIRLPGVSVGLINESLEVMDGLKNSSLNRKLPRGAGSEQQDLVRLVQDHWTEHVESN